jgi:hypothetical protein
LPRTADRHGPVRISVASSARRASPWSKATVHGRCIRGDQQQGVVASPGADAAFAGSGGQLLAFIRRERDVPVGRRREAVSIPCLTTIGYLLSTRTASSLSGACGAHGVVEEQARFFPCSQNRQNYDRNVYPMS